MPIEDCFVDCSMFTDGQILQMDDRRLLCLGDEFLGEQKSALWVRVDLGIDNEGETPRLMLTGQTGVVNGGVVVLVVGVQS